MMETDQIQKALYERSDAVTKADVYAALKTVRTWRGNSGSTRVKVAIASGQLLDRDGSKISDKVDKTLPGVQDLLNRLSYARVELTMGHILSALEEAMTAERLPSDRLAFVKRFLDDVADFRNTADELHDRVQSLEDR